MKGENGTIRSLARRAPYREPRKLVLIVCEGAKTEPGYFMRLRTKLRLTNLEVEVVGKECGSAPISVVDHATEMKRQREKGWQLPYDEVWCVMDVENPPHRSVPGAINKARDNAIKMAWSNPSFELWFLLHFEKWSKTITNEEVIRQLKRHYKNYQKNNSAIFDIIYPLTSDAIRRSVEIKREKHCENIIECNPATDVDKLVGDLIKIVEPTVGVEKH